MMKNKSLSIADELIKLNNLKEKGVLSEEEFLKEKEKLLNNDKLHNNKIENNLHAKNKFINTFPKYIFRALIAYCILTLINIWISVANPTAKYYYDDYNFIVKDSHVNLSDALLSAKVESGNYSLKIDDIKKQEMSFFEGDSFWTFQKFMLYLVLFFLLIMYPLHRLLYGDSVYKY